MNLNVGILVIRFVIGLIFMGHGLQKLIGWFGGIGLLDTAKFFAALGMDYPLFMAIIVGSIEVICGILFVFGIFIPIAGLMLSFVMIGAIIKVHGPNGFWVSQHGFEYNLVLATVSLALGLTGPGKYTIKQYKSNRIR